MLSAAHRTAAAGQFDSLSRYLDEIGRYPLLTREQEVELSRRIQGGDEEALHQLVCANLRFVVAIAKRYRHQGVAMSDLVNEGNIGLMRAAQKYDHEKGVKFISYAVWWIRQSIVQALSENAHTVRVPVHRAGAVYRLGRRVDALRQQLGREPTQQEMAAELDVTRRSSSSRCRSRAMRSHSTRRPATTASSICSTCFPMTKARRPTSRRWRTG